MDGLTLVESEFLCLGGTKAPVFVAHSQIGFTLDGLVNALTWFDLDHGNFRRTAIGEGKLKHSKGVTHRGNREIARCLPPVVLEMGEWPEILNLAFVKANSNEATFCVGEADEQVAKCAGIDAGTYPFKPLVFVAGGQETGRLGAGQKLQLANRENSRASHP